METDQTKIAKNAHLVHIMMIANIMIEDNLMKNPQVLISMLY